MDTAFMITYQEEKWTDCVDEMRPIFEDHYHEVAMYQDKIELDPDYERYEALEKAGMLRVFTVRESDILVGYNVYIVNNHLHYKTTSWASNDIIFLKPEYRRGTVASKLIITAENKLRDEYGVSVIMIHMKTHAPFDSLCKRLGYENTERLYAKYVGD